MSVLISVEHVNRDENCVFGDVGANYPYETHYATTGEAFRGLQAEYGRCVSKVYVDTPEGVKAIGWVFQKRTRYDDANETFLCETWVTLHEKEPTHTIEHHFREVSQ